MTQSLFRVEKNSNSEHIDILYLLLIILLCGIGFVALYTGSMAYAERLFNDQLYFVRRQGITLGLSLIAFILCATVRLSFIRKILPQLVIITLILLVLPFVPWIGITKNGGSRWIGLGSFTFQPSELVKVTIVIFFANLFDKKHDRLDEPEISIYPATIMTFVMIAIIYLQNDFSSALFIMFIALIMFFIAGIRLHWFAKLCVLTIPFVILMVLTEEYRVERIMSFLNPQQDPLGAGYQVNAALAALGEGQFWGRGLGNGIKKLYSIPEVQSDFIFAVWAEEMGFVGVIGYFAVLIVFSLRGYRIALCAKTRFSSLLAFGCTSVIFLQSLMNCGVVVRVFPATGVPLPFFSSGGSSLLVTLCLCGLVLNVSHEKVGEEFQNV
ncbi:MAG TPA: putative lipid II flippase FtsW [Treponema sp.]|nr:putative lipid II flippase FtsW [Treponema sp.]